MKYFVRHPIWAIDRWWEMQSRKHRLDRNPANLCMLVGLMLSSLSIILKGPSPNSSLVSMSENLQIAMCACIFVGLGIKLYGLLIGSRWFRSSVSLRCAYQKGYQGAPVASAGMFVYGFYLIENTHDWTSAIGAVLTPLLGLGVLLQGGLYWIETRRIEHVEQAMTDIAIHVKQIGDPE